VEQKTAQRPADDAQNVGERAPRLEAMDGGRAILSGGESELPREHFDLLVEGRAAQAGETRIVGLRAVENPAIKADLADGGLRIGGELRPQAALPVGTIQGAAAASAATPAQSVSSVPLTTAPRTPSAGSSRRSAARCGTSQASWR
jgi:hypothetical protein